MIQTSSRPHRLPHLAAALLISAGAALPASGQPRQVPPPSTASEPASTPNTTQNRSLDQDRIARTSDTRDLRPVTELGTEAARLESVALTMYAPVDAQIVKTSAGNESTIQISPRDGTWLMIVKAPRTYNPKLTSADVANAALIDLLGSSGLVFDAQQGINRDEIKNIWQTDKIKSVDDVTGFRGFNGLVQERNKQVTYPNFPEPAEQFFLSIPGKNADPSVRGFTVVKTGASQFVVFELLTTASQFQRVKDIQTVLLHAATIGDPEAIALERAAAINAGTLLFEKLSNQDFDAIVAASPERWERRFRPSPTKATMDEEELGYRRIKVWKGRRGELNTKANASRFSEAENQEGYLVRIDARLLERGDIIDSQSVFFVTPDRQEEDWTVSLKVQTMANGRPTGKPQVYTEIGAKRGKKLSVNVTGGGNGSVIEPLIETNGYISRVESYLLPQVLIRTGLPGDYGFYVFQSDTGNIRLRRDLVSQPADRPDAWVIETRLNEDARKQVSVYTSTGTLISSTLPDGTAWEPTQLDRLAKLWRTKGLPME
ncbi:MAG: hypothetical protein L6Q35_01935 [Phycisphaerales bacterium]|nr:hypothetical protein [Phycisphaerales bacterium]